MRQLSGCLQSSALLHRRRNWWCRPGHQKTCQCISPKDVGPPAGGGGGLLLLLSLTCAGLSTHHDGNTWCSALATRCTGQACPAGPYSWSAQKACVPLCAAPPPPGKPAEAKTAASLQLVGALPCSCKNTNGGGCPGRQEEPRCTVRCRWWKNG